MQDLLKYLRSHKSILIWGFGLEGRSTYNFLRKHLKEAKVTIADAKTPIDLPKSVDFIEAMMPDLNFYDLIIKSPGISLHKCNIKHGEFSITSQTELALRFFSKQIIGVTGTKGKSTTVTLLHNMLRKSGKKSLLVGNIGQAVFDVLEDIEKDTYLVYELSAHQLDNIGFSPHIAFLLNLYQEHLDYYGSVEKYFEAKRQIFKHQNINDIFFDEEFIKSRQINKDWNIPISIHPLSVQAMLCLAEIVKIDKLIVKKTLEDFKGLEHRLELVGEFDGAKYYNDSISTAVESAIFALQQVPAIETFIMGGDDRGIDYLPLANALKNSKVKLVITMFSSGKVLNRLLRDSNIELFHTNNFEKALKKSYKSVLFSPASASYENFKNFSERGHKFKEAVIRINKSYFDYNVQSKTKRG